jgi:predicted Zn-dependent protease
VASGAGKGGPPDRLNQALKRLSRILLPAFETAGGRYEQDLYELEDLNSAIPALHALHELRSADPDSELAHLLFTELLRNRNRLSDALRSATSVIREAIG